MDILETLRGWLLGVAIWFLRKTRRGRRFLRRRGLYPARDHERVALRTSKVRVFFPEAAPGVFDPGVHPDLATLQRRAVDAIFNRFGLKWVPGEYLTLLTTYPDPVEAFSVFCQDFGVPVDGLRQERKKAVERLQQCVGILVELSEFPELGWAHRERVLGCLRDGQYEQAEELVEIARTVFKLVHDSEELLAKIAFPHCRAFLDDLRRSLRNPFELTRKDAADARELVRDFLRWQDRFAALTAALDSQIAWMVHNWPGNDWGRDNAAVQVGLIRAKEEVERALKEDADTDIEAALARLETIYGDLLGFIEEIKRNHGGKDWHAPVDDAELRNWKAWSAAAFDKYPI